MKPQEVPFSLQYLRARCTECGECWEWGSAYRSGKWPVIASRREWDGDGRHYSKQFYIRHLMWWHKYGKPPIFGLKKTMQAKCDNPRCVNPDHMVMKSRLALVTKVAAAGGYDSMTRRFRLAEAKRRTSKLSDAAVADIRASEEKPAVLAGRHGITITYVYMLRKGEWRKDYSNPFAGLM